MKITIGFLTGLIMIVFLIGCQKDKDQNQQKAEGDLIINITDAPSDDDNIKAVFMTFAGVKLDNQTFLFDNPKTIDVSLLTSGKTEVLFDDQVDVNSYQKVELLFDLEKDQSGNSPSCYVLTKDDVKHDLNSNGSLAQSIKIKGENFDVAKEGKVELIVDFDLRKSIVYQESNVDKYEFAANIDNSLRLVKKDECYKIEGEIKDDLNFSDDAVVVYVYEKGSFDLESETKSNSENGLKFTNAISSVKVGSENKYSFHFLEEGEYDLVCVSYQKDAEGKMNAQSVLTTNVIGSLELFGITLNADAKLDLVIYGEVLI